MLSNSIVQTSETGDGILRISPTLGPPMTRISSDEEPPLSLMGIT